jgi:hypothetical protein
MSDLVDHISQLHVSSVSLAAHISQLQARSVSSYYSATGENCQPWQLISASYSLAVQVLTAYVGQLQVSNVSPGRSYQSATGEQCRRHWQHIPVRYRQPLQQTSVS